MIAMAISCNPDLLIADEPTTALDVTVQKTILKLVKDLQQQLRMGVIYITHDLGLVAEIADTVIVMYKGAIVEKGNVRDIFLHPQHPYTKALLACRPVNYAKGKRLPVVTDFMNAEIKETIDLEINQDHAFKEAEFNSINNFLPTIKDENVVILKVDSLKIYFPTRKKLIW